MAKRTVTTARRVLKQAGEARGYCDTVGCEVREVRVQVKIDEPREPFTGRTRWACPLCKRPLSHIEYRTNRELDAEHAKEARMSVNRQRYVRDEKAKGAVWVGVPMTVLFDDTLPE
jgi:hypothetical protein